MVPVELGVTLTLILTTQQGYFAEVILRKNVVPLEKAVNCRSYYSWLVSFVLTVHLVLSACYLHLI